MKQLDLGGKALKLPTGYIYDFVSGNRVKASCEGVANVQSLSERLVEEYGYPKEHLQTLPQFKIDSSSGSRAHTVDIAIFFDDKKVQSNLFMIADCKSKTRIEARHQLELCLKHSNAELGIWFNDKEHIYLQKLKSNRDVLFKEIPNIPKKGQKLDDIGRYKRRNLQRPTDLKQIFRDIRNYLAGMASGMTRDETLTQEMINILFCKIYDEINTPSDKEVTFRATVSDNDIDVKMRISDIFENKVKKEYSDIFEGTDSIRLDPSSIVYVVGVLQNYCLVDADRDAIGDAFEVFIGESLKGPEGQFFTPRNVVRMMVSILNPSTDDFIIDPACGSGGFLVIALEHVWKKLEIQAKQMNWSTKTLNTEKKLISSRRFYGVDKDNFLTKVTKAYMALIGDGRGGIICENSLGHPSSWNRSSEAKPLLTSFDVVITNPPFGSKIEVTGEKILSQFDLGRVWARDNESGEWIMTDKLRKKQSPQVLFLERCLQLLKINGRMGVIMPESLFGNPSHGYIVEYLKKNAKFLGLVSMPEALFQPYTHSKTCVLFLKKTRARHNYPIFMGIAKWCGHDSRGNKIPHDDIPLISLKYSKILKEQRQNSDRHGFFKNSREIKNNIIIPKYYDPEIESELKSLEKTHNLIPMGKLLENKIISLSTGVEIGKLTYGTGTIPFIRTSDIANWELKIDPKQGVSDEIYVKYKSKCDIREKDILLVRDGTYLIGTTAFITKYDVGILFQSHIYKIRVERPQVLSPYLMLAALNTPIVKRQIRAKQFTQDIIDTLGRRILEVILPIPKKITITRKIENSVKRIVEQRAELRNQTVKIALDVVGEKEMKKEEMDLMNI